jgi:hypothetical protein
MIFSSDHREVRSGRDDHSDDHEVLARLRACLRAMLRSVNMFRGSMSVGGFIPARQAPEVPGGGTRSLFDGTAKSRSAAPGPLAG